MDEVRCWLISGRVQGVFFRASTRRQAEPLGLSGRAINLPDGSVEVVASGPRSALDQLEAWLQHGPRSARVDSVKRVECAESSESLGGRFVTG